MGAALEMEAAWSISSAHSENRVDMHENGLLLSRRGGLSKFHA